MTTNTAVIDQQLTASEIQDAHEYLEQARDSAVAATEGLSEGQLSYRPVSGGWSIAGLLEHMVIVQDLILGRIAQMLDGPAEPPPPDCEAIDAITKAKVPDRSQKFSAPEFVHPTGRWTPSESVCRLCLNTQHLIEHLQSTPGLRLHRLPSPPLKFITGGQYEFWDGYQWILAAAGHTERHTNQILELKSEPGFPVN